MLPITQCTCKNAVNAWQPQHLGPLGEVARDIPGTKRPQRIDLKKDIDNDESETTGTQKANQYAAATWMVVSCSIGVFTDLYTCLYTDLNSMWLTREFGYPQPHQVPAAFACPRALPGNTPVITDSLDWGEIVSLSMVTWHTWSRQILLALRMLRSERVSCQDPGLYNILRTSTLVHTAADL